MFFPTVEYEKNVRIFRTNTARFQNAIDKLRRNASVQCYRGDGRIAADLRRRSFSDSLQKLVSGDRFYIISDRQNADHFQVFNHGQGMDLVVDHLRERLAQRRFRRG